MQPCKAACCSCISAVVATSAISPPFAMNTMAIVSLSAAINQSVPDAVLEANERAEREAMGRNDLQSWIAQNVYTNNRQLHPNGPRRTWRGASLLMWDCMMGVRDGLGLALTYLCQHRLDSVFRSLFACRLKPRIVTRRMTLTAGSRQAKLRPLRRWCLTIRWATSLMRSRELCESQLPKDARRDVCTSL